MGIDCSIKDCKSIKKQVKNMSLKELTYYNTKCCNCGDWVFKGDTKEGKVATDTYNEVSNKWAQKFMDKIIERKINELY